MTLSRINATAATLTKNRTEGSVVPTSGMCVTCVDGCIGMCEIGKSAYRGHEVIYPQPFGVITTAGEKIYPVDYSHFNIMGTAVGAHGIEADSDKAIFPAVNLEVRFGHDGGIKFRYPWIIPGIGSTDVAKNNWEGLAIGSALAGTGLTIGENVVGMDMEAMIEDGRVVDTVDLKRRVKLYQDHQSDGYGAIIVQANVEDTRLGAQEYAIRELGVECVELKWGQGAKNIGGEVKIRDLKKAQELHRRGYVVLPDPTDRDVIKAFERGTFREFERHSRVGMVEEEAFAQRVEELRAAGAKYVFLKTGAYRPADLARAVAWSSKYGIDLLTVDGAGGGTGMSPWHMMNEWGVPPVELHSLLYQYAKQLADAGSAGAGAGAGRRLRLRGPDLQGSRARRAIRQAGRHGARADRRGDGRQDHRPHHRRGPDPGLRRALRPHPRRDLRHRRRAAAPSSATRRSRSCPPARSGSTPTTSGSPRACAS